MPEGFIGLDRVSPYEFFRYAQADNYYYQSTSLQTQQVGALGRIADAIGGLPFYQSDASYRVAQAIESQSSVLNSINSSINAGTAAALRNGELIRGLGWQMGQINAAIGGLGRGIYENNQLTRESNNILLGIAWMVAKANNIDITDVLPQYFPKPPIYKPPSIPERIRRAKAGIEVSSLTLEMYKRVFDPKNVVRDAKAFSRFNDEQLDQYIRSPQSLYQGMVADAYKSGRAAYRDFRVAVADYQKQLDIIDGTFAKFVGDSKAKKLLGEVQSEVWNGADAQLTAIVVNLNYGDIPAMDRPAIAGYKLETPPLYPDATGSLLSVSVHFPIWEINYFGNYHSETQTNPSPSALILGEYSHPKSLFSTRLIQTDWRSYTDINKKRYVYREFSIFSPYITACLTNPDVRQRKYIDYVSEVRDIRDLPRAVRNSLSQRIIEGNLPRDLRVASNERLRADTAKIQDLLYTQKQVRGEIGNIEAKITEWQNYKDKRTNEWGNSKAARDKKYIFLDRLFGVASEVESEIDKADQELSQLRDQRDQAGYRFSYSENSLLESLQGRISTYPTKVSEFAAQIAQAREAEKKVKPIKLPAPAKTAPQTNLPATSQAANAGNKGFFNNELVQAGLVVGGTVALAVGNILLYKARKSDLKKQS